MPYLSPDAMPTTFICRRLRLPHDVQWLEIVNGALSTLLFERNFEQFGSVTPQQCVEVFNDIFSEYLKGEPCLLGSILPYATTDAPEGTLPCDGATHTKEDFPALYAALDAVYIIDADTFKTPDLTGRAIIGSGDGDGLTPRQIGDFGGEETHVLTVEELAIHAHTTEDHTHGNTPHSHTYNHPSFNIDVESAGVPDPFAVGQPMLPQFTSSTSISIDNANVTVNDAGGDEPHNNMQPFHALRYCIVAR